MKIHTAYNKNSYPIDSIASSAQRKDPDEQFKKNYSLIKSAVSQNNIGTVEHLLQPDKISQLDSYRESYLHQAVRNKDYKVAQLLILYSIDLNHVSASRWTGVSGTPLHLAVAYKSTRILDLLIASGANVDLPNEWGEAPLHIAAHYGISYEILQKLVQAGANMNAISPCSSGTTPGTPFHVAIGRNHIDTAWFLVDLGANYGLLNPNGQNAMQIAQGKKNLGAIRFLESLGFTKDRTPCEIPKPKDSFWTSFFSKA